MALFVRIVLLSTILFPTPSHAQVEVEDIPVCVASRPLDRDHRFLPRPRAEARECYLRLQARVQRMWWWRQYGYNVEGACILVARDPEGRRQPVYSYGCQSGVCFVFIGSNAVKLEVPERILVCPGLPGP